MDAAEQTLYTAISSGDTATPVQVSVPLQWTLGTDGADNRELVALGRCFRLKVESTSDTFVPTRYMRFLSRN